MSRWINDGDITSKAFICGFCSHNIASAKGYRCDGFNYMIYICPHCERPTFFDFAINKQVPDLAPGRKVDSLPTTIEVLYNEARNCISVSAYTSSVLASRKLLMNIAVEQGAEEGKSFFHYVEYLADNGYVPPNGRGWVDHIRTRGNEATHEIVVMERENAIELISFAEMLLKFVFEFPAKVPSIENS